MIDSLIACATCASNYAGGDTGNAAGWSILFMLGVILPMLAAVGYCMVRIARRERDCLDPELCDDYELDATRNR